MKIEIKKILCPVDFSECSERALNYVCAFAEAYDAEVRLLHVLEAAGAVFAYNELDVPEPELAQRLQAEYEERLRELTERIVRKGFSVSSEMVFGKPSVEIIQQARDWQADMIVLGTHGRTGLEHVLLGSVAEKVVRKAPCPVLTVRHPEHDFVSP